MGGDGWSIPIGPKRTPAIRAAAAGVVLLLIGALEIAYPVGDEPLLGLLSVGAGTLFVLLSLFLRAARGPSAVTVEDGHLWLSERGETTRVPLGPVDDVLVVEAPLGQEYPLLYLVSARGSVLELVAVAHERASAVREALAVAAKAAPAPLRRDDELGAARGVSLEAQAHGWVVRWQAWGGKQHRLELRGRELLLALADAAPVTLAAADIAAVDFVAQLHPLGAGLVLHAAAPEPATLPAQLMRRAAAGRCLPASALSRGAALALALWLESELCRERGA
jgi:hypothetical protein